MAYERSHGDIAVFYQNNKTNPKAPDYKGTVLWNGEAMEIALWSKRDNGMLTGKMQPKRAKGEYQKPAGAAYDASVKIGNKTISAKQVVASMRDDVFGFGEDEDLVPF